MPTPECRASLMHLLASSFDTAGDRATLAIFAASLAQPLWRGEAMVEQSMPVWRQDLTQASEIAGLLMPMLGCLWIVVKIIDTITRRRHREPPDESEPELKP